MTAIHDFERNLGAWLREDSEHRVPDHLEAVLVRTIATRQRPWWSSLRRWLPVDVATPRAPRLSAGAWRAIVAIAVVALLIAALIALAVGSRPKLPAPFGPARNGVLLTSADGDIFRVNPTTGDRTPLIASSLNEFGPTFSRDGTKFLFLQAADPILSSAGLRLVVANADGSDVRTITPGVDGLDWVDWSPDGTRIAFLSRELGRGRINIVNVDGTGLHPLDVGRPVNQLSWLPPDGPEIVFRGEQQIDHDPPVGIFAVRPDGSGLRPVSTRQPHDRNDFNDVAVSPDGRLVAYRAAGPDEPFSVHLIDLQTGKDRVLPSAPGSTGEGGPGFSPDGRSIVYLRWFDDASTQLVVAPVDGSNVGIAIGPHGPFGPDGPSINNYIFTPDGTAVLANYDAEKVDRLLPVDGSPGVVVARGQLAFGSFQRLAP
jgi:WD40 repeat protein